jgi:hypothetical protein
MESRNGGNTIGLVYSNPQPEDEATKGAWVESVQLLGMDDIPVEGVSTWQPARIRIGFCCSQAFRSIAVEVQVSARDGTVLTLTSTTPDRTHPMKLESGVYEIDLDVECLPFARGDYILGVSLSIPGVEYLWRREAIGWLSVGSSDIFNSGLPPDSRRYHVAIDHEWRSPRRVGNKFTEHGVRI